MMKRVVGVVVSIVAIIAVILIGIALILPRTEFVQQYKVQIAQQLTQRLGTEVQLNGDVGVSVFPSLGLSINDVVVKNPAPYQGDLARIGRLKANVELLPLIRREIKTGRITIESPFIEYIVGADGVSNIQPIIDKLQPKEEKTAEEPTPTSDPVSVAINGLDIRNGEVHYEDQKSKTVVDFKKLDVAVGAFDFNSRSTVQVGANVTSNLFNTDVRFQLESFLRYNLSRNQFFLDENTISLDDARSTALIKADLIALDLNAKQVIANTLSMDAKRDEFKLSAQADRMESGNGFTLFSIADLSGELDDELGSITAAIEEVHYNTNDKTLLAQNAKIDTKAQGTTSTLTVNDINGSIEGDDGINFNTIAGAIKYGELPYDLKIPNIRVTLDDMVVAVDNYQLSNNLSSVNGSAYLTIGEVLSARGALSAQAEEVKRLVSAATGDDIDALDRVNRAKVVGDWELNGNNIKATITEGALNDTAMTGSVAANIENMTGDVVVNLGKVIVDEYLPQQVESGGKAPAAKDAFVFPAVPTGFTLQLTAQEVDYRAQKTRVEDLSVKAVPTSSTSLDLAVGGRLDIPSQSELIATSLSASIAQTKEVLSIANIEAKASNSQLVGMVKGQSLDVEMNTGDMRLKSPQIEFTSKETKANLKAPSFLYSMNSGNMSLNDLAGSVVSGPIQAVVNIADLNANLNTKSLMTQSATARFSGKVEADAAVHGLNIDLAKEIVRADRIQMSGDSGQIDGALSMSNFSNILTANFDVSLKGNNINIPLLAEQFGAKYTPAKSGVLTNVTLDLDANYKAGDIVIDKGHFESDGSLIDTTVTSKNGVRNVQLSASNINLSDWLPDPKTASKKASSTATKAAVSPVALFLTERSTGTINLSNVIISGARVDAVNAKMNVAGSNVTLDPVSVNLYGGTSTAKAYYNYDDGSIIFENALTEIALGDLLKDMDITSIFEGKGSMKFDGGAQGGSAPLPQRLNGKGEFSISDGEILGVNFKQILVQGYSFFSKYKGRDFNYEGSTSDSTQFASLTGKVAISDGVATTNDIVLLAPALRVTGKGSYNLVNESIDYNFTAYVDKSFDGQGAEVDLASLDNGVPIHIGGTKEKPKIGVDLQALYQDKIDEEINRATNKAAKKAADKLGGNAAEILDQVLGTSISKDPESTPETESNTEVAKPSTTEPSATEPSATEQPAAQAETEASQPQEPVDPRKQAEDIIKKQAEDLLKDKLKDLF